ncbi:ABC transporter ATP-binding protein [Streptomyces sp. NPDC058548]|uniref:ABC transporter ATP-binding protein n=1 Tax=Streptomyces sp. NPDC058548 TaxID=3346545 RepID=UPI003657B503
MTELRLEALSYEERLRAVDLTVRPGETVGLIGPNGSGKTTLLRCVYGTLTPTAGRALLDGDDLHALGPKARARRVATVPQDSALEFELTVGELVALGRSPHKRFWEGDTDADRERAGDALARVGLADLADRPYPTLSGGERQRALVARALVQDPALLVLDEPTNHLDIRHQLDVLALVRTLGTTNLLALHDLNLAGAYCDRIYVLERGRLVSGGTPAEVLTPALLEAVYGVDAEVIPHPRTGSPTVLFQHRPAVGQDSSIM